MNIVLKLVKIGEYSGFCREYFKDVITKRIYIKQEEFPNVFTWYSTTKLYGEPECSLNKDVVIEEI